MDGPTSTTPPQASTDAAGSGATALLESLRPAQWTKNGFVFAALIFSRNLTDWQRVALATAAALLFCLTASALYLINDVLDAAEDRNHPVKRRRPVASGRVSAGVALGTAGLLGVAALTAAWFLDLQFFLVLAAYAAVSVLYSTLLKHVILLDVFVVAAGFVLRVIGGGVVIHVEISPWLIVCTTLLALFISLCKRRQELVLLGKNASDHRPTLMYLSPYLLDQMIGIVTASTLMSYCLYTLSGDVAIKFPGKRLELTVPFVLYGIFRYLYLVHQHEEGGSPTRLVLTDPVLVAVVLLWAASAILIIYV